MLLNILLTIMVLVSIALVGVILLQQSEGGALGMGGGGSGGFMTARGAGNLLTRATAILATLFFGCAVALTIAGNLARNEGSVLDAGSVGTLRPGQTAPAQQPATPAPAAPAGPSLDDLTSSLGSAPAASPAAAPAPAAPAPAPQR